MLAFILKLIAAHPSQDSDKICVKYFLTTYRYGITRLLY
jgi:hypothetical protein